MCSPFTYAFSPVIIVIIAKTFFNVISIIKSDIGPSNGIIGNIFHCKGVIEVLALPMSRLSRGVKHTTIRPNNHKVLRINSGLIKSKLLFNCSKALCSKRNQERVKAADLKKCV